MLEFDRELFENDEESEENEAFLMLSSLLFWLSCKKTLPALMALMRGFKEVNEGGGDVSSESFKSTFVKENIS